MALLRPLFRPSAAALALLSLAGAMACGGKKGSSTVATTPTYHVGGTIKYTKVPLHKDTNGVPTGLETDTTKFNTAAPAKGVLVKAYQRSETTLPSGGTAVGWILVAQQITDNQGNYNFAFLPAGKDYCIELVSEGFDGGAQVNLIADPAGLSSTVPQALRPRYRIRRSPAGTAATSGDVTPYSTLNADKTLDFTVDGTTSWLIGRSDVDPITSAITAFSSATFEPSPSGNRPMAILDTIALFATYYGDPTPNGLLDLHYRMGLSEPEGTFIEYNQSRWLQPDGTDLSYDADLNARHYFGSVSGGANDDALDEAVLYRLVGRAGLFHRYTGFAFSGSTSQRIAPPPAPQDNLSPELALMEGLPAAMAANLLKSPYLADTSGSGLAAPAVDIRDLSTVVPANVGPLSPRTLAAASWTLILKANSLPDPGISTDWDKINSAAFVRFFSVLSPSTDTTVGTVTTTAIDLPSVFNQIKRLQAVKSTSEPVDLAKVFTDSALTPLLAPYNIPWPQPTTGADSAFVSSWGSDPTLAHPDFTLSMAQAQAVNGVFPNLTAGEVQYAYFNLSANTNYDLNITTTPSTLPSGAQVEVSFLSPAPTQLSLVSAGSTGPIRMPLVGGTASLPINQALRVRLLSPSVQIPDVKVTLAFTQVLTPTRPR